MTQNTLQKTMGTAKVRKAEDRGLADFGWLESRHSFSFGEYHDPDHMGYGPLRVINDDRVAPGKGFGAHPHRDMEIISYVVEGALEHKDSMGNGSVIRPGDVQRMSAGTGVQHSEYNPSDSESVHFLQIWIQPERKGLSPSYEQKHFTEDERRNLLRLVASRDARDGSLAVHQDAELYAGLLDAGVEVDQPLDAGRRVWVQVVSGELDVNGTRLSSGDGAAVEGASHLKVAAVRDSELLVFNLA